jgi:hypothetical protein
MAQIVALAVLGMLVWPAAPAHADDAADFMQRFGGRWIGSGQVLIGPEDGLEFQCSLDGDPSRTRLTFGMTGRCWMGRLGARIHARLRYNPETNRFYGDFLGGSEGDGVDVVGVRDGDGFSLDLSRGSVQGRLAAEAIGSDEMRVIIFYRDPTANRELPIVAMGFTRSQSGAAGPVGGRSDYATGTTGPGK